MPGHSITYSLVCARCGKLFERTTHYPPATLSYCSRQCRKGFSVAGFWAKVDQTTTPDACWPWTGAHDRDGYGFKWLHGHTTMAHRVAYELAFGPIADGLKVCHTCDNPPCCRPSHLFLGTVSDNARDMVKKGRSGSRSGEENGSARLSLVDARDIKTAYAKGGTSIAKLAAKYSVSFGAIWFLLHGQTWKCLNDKTPKEKVEN